MEVIKILQKRYAVKKFTGEKIKDKDVKIMKESIRLAPSSFNLQPWKIKVISDKKELMKLQEASFNQPQVGSASHLFVFCSINSLKNNANDLIKSIKKNAPQNAEVFSNIVNGAISNMTLDDQKKLSERELFMSVENLMLVTTDLGYGSCPIGGFDAKKFKKILSIPKGLEPVVICAVGFPADSPREKFRFDNKDLFF